LYIVSVCEHVKFAKKITGTNNDAAIETLGSAFYVDKQLYIVLYAQLTIK